MSSELLFRALTSTRCYFGWIAAPKRKSDAKEREVNVEWELAQLRKDVDLSQGLEQDLDKRSRELQERDDGLQVREDALNRREQAIQEIESEYTRKYRELQKARFDEIIAGCKRDAEFQKKSDELQLREEAVQKRETDLQQKIDELQLREEAIQKREPEIDGEKSESSCIETDRPELMSWLQDLKKQI